MQFYRIEPIRHGRSLVDLLGMVQGLRRLTPVGKLKFQITGAFAEFERSIIWTRVNAGLQRAKDKDQIKKMATPTRSMRSPEAPRPSGADPDKLRKARAELAKGIGIVRVAEAVGLGVGTVAKLKNVMGDRRCRAISGDARTAASVRVASRHVWHFTLP
jgi:DNA invertase Pin-like site-specific DNA recombinase